MSVRRFVKRLPYPIRQGIKYTYGTASRAIPPRLRYGKVFWDTYNFLQESQWWSTEKLEEYQMQQLSKLLDHGYKNVPYYRRVFDERGLKPAHIQDFDDLAKLPYLEKGTVHLQGKYILAENFNVKSLTVSHTSGTTGKALHFYQDTTTSQKEKAFIYHQWSRVGFQPGDASIQLRGAISRRRLVHYDPFSRIMRLSPLVDSKETTVYYLRKMSSFGARFLHGYPGAIASLARMIKIHGLTVPIKVKAVLFASEAIYEWERELVQEVFSCRVFSHYGMAEKVVLAAECEQSNRYHCLPQYGVTEIDPESHEIIGTGFLNYVNPFIRYRTTDVSSVPVDSGCEKCGRNYYPVFEKVEGRLEDFIITSRGALIAPAAITHPFKDLKTIKDTQVVQECPDRVIVRAVPWDEGNLQSFEAEIARLCQDLQDILGTDMHVQGKMTEEIERPKTGKYKWIVSEVSRDSLEKGIKEI
jgi:phenylacetate-CoA ligase